MSALSDYHVGQVVYMVWLETNCEEFNSVDVLYRGVIKEIKPESPDTFIAETGLFVEFEANEYMPGFTEWMGPDDVFADPQEAIMYYLDDTKQFLDSQVKRYLEKHKDDK